MQITQHPSPNFGARRQGAKPDLIVLHYTGMQSAGAALARLCDPQFAVSAHYLIWESGEVLQLVAEEMRAWHAGQGAWGNCRDVNSASIGIELANDGLSAFAAPQIQSLDELLHDVMQRWSIVRERVIGHSDMAPERKFDPGRRFDWQRLTRDGCSVWPAVKTHQDPDKARFLTYARIFGYPPCDDFAALLSAFRSRFRPDFNGPLDAVDMAIIADLSHRFPVDLIGPSA